MKVLMLNGSCNLHGCTYTALTEIGNVLNENGIEYEIFQLGSAPVMDCIGCGQCRNGNGCAFSDNDVNEFTKKAMEARRIYIWIPCLLRPPQRTGSFVPGQSLLLRQKSIPGKTRRCSRFCQKRRNHRFF